MTAAAQAVCLSAGERGAKAPLYLLLVRSRGTPMAQATVIRSKLAARLACYRLPCPGPMWMLPFTFRVVLYEMLTGQRLFQGDDATETLALVIKDEPKWERVPAKVQRLVRSCLKKDPKRLQAIGDWGGRTIRRCTPCFLSRNLLIRLVRR